MQTETKTMFGEMAERAARRVEEAVQEGIDTLVDAAAAKASEISAGYSRKASTVRDAEATMFEAQAGVDALRDGRQANLAAISEATLDDDQEGVKALQRDEKTRKKDLAGAEGVLEKAQARYAASKVEGGLYVESQASLAAVLDVERELQRAVSEVGTAASAAAEGIATPHLNYGGLEEEAQRLFPRGEGYDESLVARRRAELQS